MKKYTKETIRTHKAWEYNERIINKIIVSKVLSKKEAILVSYMYYGEIEQYLCGDPKRINIIVDRINKLIEKTYRQK